MMTINWAGFLSMTREDISRVGCAKGNMEILEQALTEGFQDMKPITFERKKRLVKSIQKFNLAATELELLLTALMSDLECREAGIDPEGAEG